MSDLIGKILTTESGEKVEIVKDPKSVFGIGLKPVEEEWPQRDDKYYFINSSLEVTYSNYVPKYSPDAARKKTGNCFLTREQATLAAEAVKELFKYIKQPEHSWRAAYTQKALEARRAVNE